MPQLSVAALVVIPADEQTGLRPDVELPRNLADAGSRRTHQDQSGAFGQLLRRAVRADQARQPTPPSEAQKQSGRLYPALWQFGLTPPRPQMESSFPARGTSGLLAR